MKSVIGVDYDGVIGDTGRMKVDWIRERTGLVVMPWQTDRTTCVELIGLEAYEEMGHAVYERELTLAAPPVRGSIEALTQLCRHREVFVITARSHRWAVHAEEWLWNQNLTHRLAGVRCIKLADGTARTKADLCRELGVQAMIDDDERHLRDIEIPALTRILFKDGCQDRPAGLQQDILYAASWTEVLPLL